MRTKALFSILLFLLGLTISFAQEEKTFKTDYQIESKAFGDERQISVYLPPNYYDYPDMKYTITYVLDGHFDPFIDLVAKTIEYNTYMYNYTPTIVVGVHAKDRGWEFSAPDEGDDDDYKGGRAPELQQHFKNEIFPLIDSLYPNTLDFKSIIGHSSGGHFVLYTLFGPEKDLFDSYIGISPALRPGENHILEEASKQLSAGHTFKKFLYCSSGTVSEREELFGEGVRKLDSTFKAHPKNGLIWRKNAFAGMDHWTCVGPSVNDAMVELTRAFRVDEKTLNSFAYNPELSVTEQIESFYQNLDNNYSFKEIPLPGYLKGVAWELSVKDKNKEALEIYNWGIKQFPKNFTLRKYKGKLFLKMNRMDEAKKAFEASLDVLDQIKDEVPESFYTEQQEYIKGKIKECENVDQQN